MEIKTFSKWNQTCVSLIGKLCTLNDYQQLRNHINNTKIKSDFLIVDLNRLTFTSSHGLGELVAISNALKKRKQKLLLFNPREEIKSIISLAGIDQVTTLLMNEHELERELDLKT